MVEPKYSVFPSAESDGRVSAAAVFTDVPAATAFYQSLAGSFFEEAGLDWGAVVVEDAVEHGTRRAAGHQR